MNGPRMRRRGQPLVFYALILVGWIGMRMLTWESPLPARLVSMAEAAPRGIAGEATGQATDTQAVSAQANASEPVRPPDLQGKPPVALPQTPAELPLLPSLIAPAPPVTSGAATDPAFTAHSGAAAHQLMWLAAMAQLPVPRELEDAGTQARAAPPPQPWLAKPEAQGERRWSLDAWVFLREGSGELARSAGPRPSYGASQQGAVLRYRLTNAAGFDPRLYARYVRALAGVRETDLALGIQARPVSQLPLTLHAEMRVTYANGDTDWRPAVFATTGLYRELSGGLQLRGYGQAGYVGGDFATAFVDGQMAADRAVASFDLGRTKRAQLRVGGGIWGGAQKGSERIDIGPSANVVVPVADAPVRLSLDYRLRVAGDAQPGSGVAVTLSTGF